MGVLSQPIRLRRTNWMSRSPTVFRQTLQSDSKNSQRTPKVRWESETATRLIFLIVGLWWNFDRPPTRSSGSLVKMLKTSSDRSEFCRTRLSNTLSQTHSIIHQNSVGLGLIICTFNRQINPRTDSLDDYESDGGQIEVQRRSYGFDGFRRTSDFDDQKWLEGHDSDGTLSDFIGADPCYC